MTRLTYCETITSSSYEMALSKVLARASDALGATAAPDIEVDVSPVSGQVYRFEFTLTYRRTEEE